MPAQRKVDDVVLLTNPVAVSQRLVLQCYDKTEHKWKNAIVEKPVSLEMLNAYHLAYPGISFRLACVQTYEVTEVIKTKRAVNMSKRRSKKVKHGR